VRAASLAALAGAFLLHRFEQVELPLAPLLLGTTAPALWALRHERASPMLSAALWLLLGLLCMAAPAQVPPGALALVPLTCLLSPAARSSNFSSFSRLWAFVAGNPARLMVLSFLTICLIGGLALTLPLSHQPGQTAAFVDALFTSVSATCVTGLATVDTPTTWSFFGQLVIATLIQVGGLGIMTFAAGASVWLGARLSLRHEAVAADLIGPDARSDLRGALRTVLQVTFGVEALCALILWLSFMVRHGEAAVPAAWRAVFTAVSAFCNAGFALQSDSLITYQRDPIVILTIGFTIVIGGLGPAVAVAVAQRRAFKSLYPRMVVTTSALLLLIPAVLIAFFEWNHTLTGLSTVDRLVNALFQSITLRTAGFNSVDIAAIQPPTWTVMVIAMFIGGSPASTAGGIKTTTFAVLVLSALAAIRGRDEATAWKRRIPHRVVYDAAAITMLMMLCVLIGLTAIQLTQRLSLEHALFEVVSALGTVGLSMGATARLDSVGKILIMLGMFIGRVGPLTLFVFLAGRARDPGTRYPEDSVPVG
jgi:trk system potassium uptake protein TrkH